MASEAPTPGDHGQPSMSSDREYRDLMGSLRDFGWQHWYRLDEVVGQRLSEAVDTFTNNVNNEIIDVAEQMERACKNPPCLHAQGLRLAISYIEGKRLC